MPKALAIAAVAAVTGQGCLIGLRSAGVIHWRWGLVLLPLWVALAAVVALLIGLAVLEARSTGGGDW